MAKPHWFPFYVHEFLSSPAVTLMTAEEVGGYILLLCYAWQDKQGSVPGDDDSLRILSRVRGDLSRIKSCFHEKKGRLYNARLTQELENVQKKSVSAQQSAVLRWQCERNANALRAQHSTVVPTQCSSQSQSQSQLHKKGSGREKSPARALEKPIPEMWKPTDNHRKLAQARGLDLAIEAAHFKGKAEEKGWVTRDWDKKFTNWMLQEIKFRQQRRAS